MNSSDESIEHKRWSDIWVQSSERQRVSQMLISLAHQTLSLESVEERRGSHT